MAASASESTRSKRHLNDDDDDVVVLLEWLHTSTPRSKRCRNKPYTIPDDDDVVVLLEVRKTRPKETIVIPDEEDCYEIPYRSTSAIGGENYSMQFKGLVVEDNKNKEKFGAIGVAILDSTNSIVVEVSEPLVLPDGEMNEEVAQLEAFVHGLELAWDLELRFLVCSSLHFDLDSYETKEPKVAELVHRALFLKKRFRRCHLSKIEKNAQLVLELAKSSIANQAGRPFEEVIRIEEKCPICLEDVDSKKMIEIDSCLHRFCSSCLKMHVELKVRGREVPRCPQPNCGLDIKIASYGKLIAPKTYNLLEELVKESLIPTTEKLYCPNPRCSNLMSKTDALAMNRNLASSSAMDLTACRCVKCHTLFCMNCKVLWHSNLSCGDYNKRGLDPRSDDAKLKLLVGHKKWRQCPMCSHMVELAHGCYHIYCRCGHQFCYMCGLEWKKHKATCSCPLWGEANIIFRHGNM